MEAINLTFLDFFKKYVFFFIFIYIHIEKNRFIGSIGYKVNKFNTLQGIDKITYRFPIDFIDFYCLLNIILYICISIDIKEKHYINPIMSQKSIAGDLWDFLILFYFMKIFITNKKYFEDSFDEPSRFENSNREPLTSSQIHKNLFKIISNQITIEHSIPLCVLTEYDNGEGMAIFDFITKKGEVLYYQYSTTVS